MNAGDASLGRQVMVLSRRSISRTFRQPSSWIFPAVFPLILLGINSAGLADATKIPGFPADSYFEFALVVTFMQASLFAMSSAGLGLATDIESGFMDRLAMTPMRASALVVGQLVGAVTLSVATSLVYITIGFAFGASYQSGALGVLLLLLLATWTAFAFACLGSWIALKSGSSEAMQGIFPLLFATLFLSTMNMPRELIDAGWFHAVVVANPVSYLVDGLRSLIVVGWDWTALWRDIAVLGAVTAVTVTGCARTLRRRLVGA